VAKRLIEVFTAGCSVCEGAVEHNFFKKIRQIKMHGSEGKMEEHFFSLSINNKLTIANGGGGNVHVQVI
jgi:hypothetical protein